MYYLQNCKSDQAKFEDIAATINYNSWVV